MVATGSGNAAVLRCLACRQERPVRERDFGAFNAFLLEHLACRGAGRPGADDADGGPAGH